MNIPIIYQSVSYDQHSMIHNDVKILVGNLPQVCHLFIAYSMHFY